jgi:hypothetical protein
LPSTTKYMNLCNDVFFHSLHSCDFGVQNWISQHSIKSGKMVQEFLLWLIYPNAPFFIEPSRQDDPILLQFRPIFPALHKTSLYICWKFWTVHYSALLI